MADDPFTLDDLSPAGKAKFLRRYNLTEEALVNAFNEKLKSLDDEVGFSWKADEESIQQRTLELAQDSKAHKKLKGDGAEAAMSIVNKNLKLLANYRPGCSLWMGAGQIMNADTEERSNELDCIIANKPRGGAFINTTISHTLVSTAIEVKLFCQARDVDDAKKKNESLHTLTGKYGLLFTGGAGNLAQSKKSFAKAKTILGWLDKYCSFTRGVFIVCPSSELQLSGTGLGGCFLHVEQPITRRIHPAPPAGKTWCYFWTKDADGSVLKALTLTIATLLQFQNEAKPEIAQVIEELQAKDWQWK